MSLKQNIIIVNEYSKIGKNGKGSNGSTLDAYIEDYMCRDSACEAGSSLVPNTGASWQETAEDWGKIRREAGSCGNFNEMMKQYFDTGTHAFNAVSLSLSKQQTASIAENIQQLFKKGNPVYKTVVSFKTEYLQQKGILPDGLEAEGMKKGDLFARADQTKLRYVLNKAICEMANGKPERMEWIAVIQSDTRNIHCHLCMCSKDPTDRLGYIGKKDRDRLRRVIDNQFEVVKSHSFFQSLSEPYRQYQDLSRMNVAARRMNETALLQQISMALPKDKKLWLAESKDPKMKRANRLAALYVGRTAKEADMDGMLDDWLTRQSINVLYRWISRQSGREKPKVPDYLEEKNENERSDLERSLKNQNEAARRLEHHLVQRRIMLMNLEFFDSQEASEDAKAMRDYFRTEYEYHDMAASKYQHFYWQPLTSGQIKEASDLYQKGKKAHEEGNEEEARTHFKRLLEKLSDVGRTVKNGKIVRYIRHSLEKVRFIDLHFDRKSIKKATLKFKTAISEFRNMAKRRFKAMKNAMNYLRRTGQEDVMEAIDVSEVAAMKKTQEDLDAGFFETMDTSAVMKQRTEKASKGFLNLNPDTDESIKNEIIYTIQTQTPDSAGPSL